MKNSTFFGSNRMMHRAYSVPSETLTRAEMVNELDGSQELLALRLALIESATSDSSTAFCGPSSTLRRSANY